MKVGLLTIEQKNEIAGKEYAPDSYFNPIQDLNNNWVISTQEISGCEIEWVKNLPLIDFKPKKVTLIK